VNRIKVFASFFKKEARSFLKKEQKPVIHELGAALGSSRPSGANHH
jgi:hypothetical protein